MIKNITFSVEDWVIRKARQKAEQSRKSLNDLFREWVTRYVGAQDSRASYRSLMKRLGPAARPGKKFSRDEMNER